MNDKMHVSAFIERLKHYIDQLTDEERLELFHRYCIYCGKKDYLPCYCMRDE
jgi:hypothetical protein